MGSAAASAAVRRALAPNTNEGTKQWAGSRVSSGPRGRGPLRPRWARSPRLLHRSDTGEATARIAQWKADGSGLPSAQSRVHPLATWRCANFPGRKTWPAARASPRSYWPRSLRSLRSLWF